jgi:hypothetical protein
MFKSRQTTRQDIKTLAGSAFALLDIRVRDEKYYYTQSAAQGDKQFY